MEDAYIYMQMKGQMTRDFQGFPQFEREFVSSFPSSPSQGLLFISLLALGCFPATVEHDGIGH